MPRNTIPHPRRKNAHAADQYALLRKATNAARPKQVWIPVLDEDGQQIYGYWRNR